MSSETVGREEEEEKDGGRRTDLDQQQDVPRNEPQKALPDVHETRPQDVKWVKDGWNPELNQDEAIMAQEKQIERDIADRIPLVGDEIGLEALENEYSEDDTVYQGKIMDLMKSYRCMRRTRPDGNCFFRAFAFSYLETLLGDDVELKRFIQVTGQSKSDLLALGFSSFTIEDFHDTFLGILRRMASGQLVTREQLLDDFNNQGISDYLVVFLRLVTSGHLQKNELFFSNFIEGEATVKEFCSHEVEPMYKESDHIHIIALTSAADVGVRINYLDRGSGEAVIVHNFPDGCVPRIHLLYRPGHYDILYPRVGHATDGRQVNASNGCSAKC